jgi:site-specific recombinase XerD
MKLMTAHNANNERIKHQYFGFLKEAKRQSEASVDACAKALDRFETYNRHRDFKAFHFEQAIGFKRHLSQQRAQRSGQELSKATMHSTLMHLKHFFQWLSGQPGYKSRLKYSNAEYFNLSEKDVRVATAHRLQKAPTLEQVKHVICAMPARTDIELRNRALIAFVLLTGARDSAIASLKLKHVDLTEGCVNQDAREVNTKFSKTFPTFFFPVGSETLQIIVEWVAYLREAKIWGNDDPLFPATQVVPGASRHFEAAGLERRHWASAAPIRTIFREAFKLAGLPYFNPHSFRNTLVRLGEKVCRSPEQFKAWSQNLGHEKALTTFLNYGEVAHDRQAEIIRNLGNGRIQTIPDAEKLAEALLRQMSQAGLVRAGDSGTAERS